MSIKSLQSEIATQYDDPAEELEWEYDPEGGDIATEDHIHWYQYGKLVLTVGIDNDHNAALRKHMADNNFWPDVWWISDHGNANLLTLED